MKKSRTILSLCLMAAFVFTIGNYRIAEAVATSKPVYVPAPGHLASGYSDNGCNRAIKIVKTGSGKGYDTGGINQSTYDGNTKDGSIEVTQLVGHDPKTGEDIEKTQTWYGIYGEDASHYYLCSGGYDPPRGVMNRPGGRKIDRYKNMKQ